MTTCPYCRTIVEAEYDPEMHREYQPESHFSCRTEVRLDDPACVAYVRTVQNAATPPVEHRTGFKSLRRAREHAAWLRSHNLRTWPCGEKLDILVGQTTTTTPEIAVGA